MKKYIKKNKKSRLELNLQFHILKNKLIFQNINKAKIAAELIIANKEILFQNKKREALIIKLVIEKNKLIFENKKIAKLAGELIIANKEKAKRAAELIIANKVKEKHEAELIIANKEKAKRASELTVINKELKDSEEELVDSRNMYKNLFESANDAIWLMNKNVFLDCNKKSVKLFGCDNKNQIINHSPLDFSTVKQADGQYSRKLAKRYIKAAFLNHPQRFNWKHKTKKELIIDVEMSLNRIMINGKYYLQATGRDVTESLKIQEKLVENNYLVKNVNCILLRWTPDERISFINEYGARIFGYKKNELIGKKVGIFVPKVESTGRKLVSLISNITKNPEKYLNNENENLKKDGNRIWISWNNRAIRDERGKLKEILAVGIDSTKTKIAEGKLKESEEKYRTLISSMDQGVALHKIITNKHGKPINYIILDVNSAYERLTGLKRLNIINKKVLEVLPHLEKHWIDTYGKVAIDGKPVHIINYAKDLGKYYDVTVYSPKIGYFAVIFSDVTEKIKTENILIENEKLLQSAQDIANFGSYVLDIKTGIWTSSKVLNKIFGIDNKYIRSVDGWSNIVHPDDRDMMKKYFSQSVLGKGLSFNKVYRIMRINDGSVLWVHGKGLLEFDKNKKPIKMIGTIQDITESKELDEAKSGFLSIASHQLRTPLSMTKWVLESLMQQGSLNLKQKDKLNNLIYSNERLIHLVNDLLKVSTIDTGKFTVNKRFADINEVTERLLLSIKHLAEKENKDIKIVGFSNLKKIYCDPILIYEALENLLINAISYSSKNTRNVTIKIKEEKNQYVISVNNDGVINKKSLKRINLFDKFTRGHNASEIQPTGSGLGLYITKKMIEVSGGKLWLESNANMGTTFYFTIIKKK